MECRLAKAEPWNHGLAMRSNEGIDRLDITAVRIRKCSRQILIVPCEFFKGLGDAHAEHASEGTIARDAALPITEDVDGAHVPGDAIIGGLEVAEEVGIVMVRNGAGVVDAKRVKCVGKRKAVLQKGSLGVFKCHLFNWNSSLVFAVFGNLEKGDVIYHSVSYASKDFG